MNKLDGIKILKHLRLKTVNLYDINDILSGTINLQNGISVRLSSNNSIRDSIDVNLPSIHNCKTIKEIADFYEHYHNDYIILIHDTVKPTIIGSVSKYYLGSNCIFVVESFTNFDDRKNSIIKNRYIFEYIGETYIDFKNCKNTKVIQLINEIRKISFESFDLEFVMENEDFVFTDLYVKTLKRNF